MKRFDFRNITVIVGAALFFALMMGKPFLPAWFRPYAHLSGFLVAAGMFGVVALQNKISTGLALPGRKNGKIVISRTKIVALIIILILAVLLPIFHLFKTY
ncbi:hypothetical protein RFM68_28950 [Mesorhizobium sp. MSK_1335]|uniref:Tripartite tricarboxylate transporter TctB family protein n=1 Tax=Mesorhizobium montanum TaxID=3072323 RepID=A0ABU4ZSZ7_9HYPH|nr:hypothetical protein [Mesorhizobium sp. MSK_1335]MDX8528514.1 hypothetical protein [Mesorhizobium sp. MSK_1335]